MKLTKLAAILLLPALSAPAFADHLDDDRSKNIELSRAEPSAEVFYKRASMASGKTEEYTVRMEAGQQYGLYADCGDDCSDLDMQWLYNGKVLSEDMGDNKFSLLTVTPEQSGHYVIRPFMSECFARKCDYHVQVVKEERSMDMEADHDTYSGTLSDASLPPAEFLAAERIHNLHIATNSEDKSAEVLYRTGKLAAGKSADYSVALKAGQAYAFYSDCAPASCNNVDMQLLHNGRVVASDTEDDTYPLFHYTPERNGTYTVRPKMVECKEGNDTCDYHVQVIKEQSQEQ